MNYLQRYLFVCFFYYSFRCGFDDQEEDVIWLCLRFGEFSFEMLVYFCDFYYVGDIDGFCNMVCSKLIKKKSDSNVFVCVMNKNWYVLEFSYMCLCVVVSGFLFCFGV